ncbi:glycoside hydrolase family 88/105 protein [Alteromonas confluentis]|uniref:Glycosyl hydrolase family 88 n=1 Tax=Alteromonas confluentis TaxID=1656094 RepID=A0A1E7ZBF1_9ALTE|nr:glycoside hydrolase family 88 protein [Alteromonas confluentis]OFC70839.1 glycosyl hydrolase family 88 [Alteromonas confluentis]
MKLFRKIITTLTCTSLLTACVAIHSTADELTWIEKVANTTMARSPEAWAMRPHKGLTEPDWSYTYGLVLLGFQRLYQETGNEAYLNYAKTWVDSLIDENGNIKDYVIYEFNIDDINAGKLLFMFYEQTQDPRYLKAMQQLRQQLDWQPRTREGGFWHKRIYPWQMWLDGLYMGSAYLAQYAHTFGEDSAVFDDIALQFTLIESKTRDEKTGLLFHGWDESRLQQWADQETGLSQQFWSRAMGWYAMALVDTLEVMPADHGKRQQLLDSFKQLMNALKPWQQASGIWLQVTDQVGREGNYEEASGTAMFAYAIAKGVRLGYLTKDWTSIAQKAFDGLTEELIVTDSDTGQVHLTNICGSAGLGGNPYRSGSFEYYVNEAKVTDDAHGIGPYILAGIELIKLKQK